MSWQRSKDGVVVSLSEEEYVELLFFATMGAVATGGIDPRRVFRLLNSMNDGNPNYTPYDDQGRRAP